jgi:hypothetical protein
MPLLDAPKQLWLYCKEEPNVTAYSGDRRLDIALITLDRPMMATQGGLGAAVEVPPTGQEPA